MRSLPVRSVLVTGGAGYVGSVLVPKLLQAGYRVHVLDLYIYGEESLAGVRGHPNLMEVRGDLRDPNALRRAVEGCDAVLHLACISNDPSFELDPDLGKSINYDAFFGLLDASAKAGIRRFVYASSSSVYGVKQEPQVTEDLPLEPLTDYSRYKAMCEEVLRKEAHDFTHLTIRPATVCGWSPRLRLDLIVNILTSHAYHHRKVTVFGGEQMRPNLHIEDMADLYVQTLRWQDSAIDGKTYNVGADNHTVAELASMVRSVVGPDVAVTSTPTNDPRSYRISSERIHRELGWEPRRTVRQAVEGLVDAFQSGLVPQALESPRYHNIRMMQQLRLK